MDKEKKGKKNKAPYAGLTSNSSPPPKKVKTVVPTKKDVRMPTPSLPSSSKIYYSSDEDELPSAEEKHTNHISEKNPKPTSISARLNPAKDGHNFLLKSLINDPHYIGNVNGYNWKVMPIKSKQTQNKVMCDSRGNPMSVMVYGLVKKAFVGLYGNYNRTYAESASLSKSYLGLELVSHFGNEDIVDPVFAAQLEKIKEIEDSIIVADTSDNRHRATNSDQTGFVAKRKLTARGVRNGIVPTDQDGLNNWTETIKDDKLLRFNPPPLGVFSVDGEITPFGTTGYDKAICEGQCAVILGRIEAVPYQGKFFVRIVPISIRTVEFNNEGFENLVERLQSEDESYDIPDIF